MLHTLFAREHNSICDRLKADFPTWSDEELFHKARLINAALLAKIHTVEWTPAIIAHPTTEVGVPANWWGLTGEDGLLKQGRFSDSDVISGIPGSDTDHHGVPYSLTEEFIAVYRLHPLIPDNFAFRAVADDSQLGGRIFPDIFGPKAKETMDAVSFHDLFYSFGVAHPGAVTLHNYPKFLQRFERHDGPLIDLAAVDILRDRERGVPRYNDFRRLLHLEVRQSFEELTENPEWREELRRVYGNDVNRVDLMVGMYAETPPPGFGFSDTAFRIFILMATRRLKSDRFFTVDYRPEIYTQAGIDWVESNNMMTVLLRHCPELKPAMGRKIASCLDAPMPNAASRIAIGTDFSAALVTMIMVGNVISDSTIPPTSGAERGRPNQPRKTAKPSNPNTTDGTAARLLMLISMISVQRFWGANSSR
jgi:hypothetical protein